MPDPIQTALAIEYLVAGETNQSTADKLGVSLRTIGYWRADPDFKKALADRQAEVISDIKLHLPRLAEMALKTFEECLEGRHGDTAAYRSAELVLRTIGLLGEGAYSPVNADETVQLIEIGLNDKDEVVQLATPSPI